MPRSVKIIGACCLVVLGWRYVRGDFINPLTASLVREGMPYPLVEIILCDPPRQTENRLPIETFSNDTYCRREGFRYPGDDKVRRLWFSDAAWIYLVFDKQDWVLEKRLLTDLADIKRRTFATALACAKMPSRAAAPRAVESLKGSDTVPGLSPYRSLDTMKRESGPRPRQSGYLPERE